MQFTKFKAIRKSQQLRNTCEQKSSDYLNYFPTNCFSGFQTMKTLKVDEIVSENTSCLILFGTQLGNAESIAEGLLDTATSEHFLEAKLFALNELSDIAELAKVNCPIVIVTSTTGDGEAPENADKFLRKLRRKLLKSNTLESVRYTILGLGDTNFNNFCNCGKLIHKRFQELGATLFYPPGWADDAVGLEQVIEPWIENLWENLKTAIDNTGSLQRDPEAQLKKSTNPVKKLFSKMLASDKSKETNLARKSPQIPEAVGETTLTLPSCPTTSLNLEYKGLASAVPEIDLLKPPATYPLIHGEPYTGKILNAKLLTTEQSVKTTIELTIGIDKKFDFEPGDAIGIICPNSSMEVETLLETLDLKREADKPVTLSIKPGTKGKFPAHIPRECTIRQILLWYSDIRAPPKKAFVRLLAESTTDEKEKATLLELCSKQGAALYEKSIRHPSTSLLDILLKFPTCKPRIESLLEYLPRLIPRPYSISSSPLFSTRSFTIVFNIIQFPEEIDLEYRKYSRCGVCTGWLCTLGKKYFSADTLSNLADSVQRVSINDTSASATTNVALTEEIIFYKRKNHNFRLPKSLDSSVIMVGPGTGVAPFIGFIQHRNCQKDAGEEIGSMYLYFGCRHRDRDFIYEESLKDFASSGVLTQLNTSFSRDIKPDEETHLKYVQDLLQNNKEELVEAILDKEAYFYVCGDAKNMAKNVRETIIACIQSVKGLSEKEAMEKISGLVSEKRYLQDVWS